MRLRLMFNTHLKTLQKIAVRLYAVNCLFIAYVPCIVYMCNINFGKYQVTYLPRIFFKTLSFLVSGHNGCWSWGFSLHIKTWGVRACCNMNC